MRAIRWTTSEMKEIILALLALIWGILLLFPGNVLTGSPTAEYYALYSNDWLWGILLIIFSAYILFGPRKRWFHFRKYIHLYFWFFWLGIAVLTIVRSSANGVGVTDILIISPFVAIALVHATLYARLVSA